jgi:hypothetical protein
LHESSGRQAIADITAPDDIIVELEASEGGAYDDASYEVILKEHLEVLWLKIYQ